MDAEQFFAEYGRVFDTWDMEAFSKMFCEPFVSVRPDGTVASMPTNKVAQEFFETVLEVWKKEGYKTFGMRDFDVTPIGTNSALVTLTWELLDSAGDMIRDWRQSYNLLNTSDGWKVITSTFHS